MNAEAKTEVVKRPMFEPGWYKDMSNEDYHGSSGYSSTKLKTLVEWTPAHLRYSYFEEDVQKDHLDNGDAFHCLTLQPHLFEKKFAVIPKDVKKPTAAQLNAKNPSPKSVEQMLAWDDWQKELGDRTQLTQDGYDKVRKMADNVRKHKMAKPLLEDIVAESSIFWWYRTKDIDDDTQYKQMLKVRPDAICRGQSAIIDLKSTRDASYTGFQKQIMNYYYHLSAAMYLEGVNQCKALLQEMSHFAYTHFVFICVENFPPYEVAVYDLDKSFLEVGKILFRRAVRDVQRGHDENWPGYPEEIRVMEAPTWASRNFIV